MNSQKSRKNRRGQNRITYEKLPRAFYSPLREQTWEIAYDRLLDVTREFLSEAPVYGLARIGVVVWARDDRVYGFRLKRYNSNIFRLISCATACKYEGEHEVWKLGVPFLPSRLLGIARRSKMRGPEHEFELTFLCSELPLITGFDLVSYVELIFECKELCQVYRWPLFSVAPSYPAHAWTRESKIFEVNRTAGQIALQEARRRRQEARSELDGLNEPGKSGTKTK